MSMQTWVRVDQGVLLLLLLPQVLIWLTQCQLEKGHRFQKYRKDCSSVPSEEASVEGVTALEASSQEVCFPIWVEIAHRGGWGHFYCCCCCNEIAL